MEKLPERRDNMFLKSLLLRRTKLVFALSPESNSRTGIKEWQIKPGTTMMRGRAVPQFEYGFLYSGGEEQIFVMQPWSHRSLL